MKTNVSQREVITKEESNIVIQDDNSKYCCCIEVKTLQILITHHIIAKHQQSL